MEVLRNDIGLNNGGKFTIYNSNQLTGSIQLFITTDGSTNFNELVKENQCYMVVGNLDPNTVKEVVDKVVNILKSQNYNNINPNITVLTQNDVEKQQSENLKNIVFQDDRLKIDVNSKENSNEQALNEHQENNISKKQSDLLETFNVFLAAKMVQKVDNGIIKNYVTRSADKFSNGYLLDEVKPQDMITYYNKMIDDEKTKQEISNLSPEEISNRVLDYIASEENKKKYYLEKAEQGFSSSKSGVEGRKENAINDEIQKTDGFVSPELGVGVTGPADVRPTDSVVVSEKDGDHIKTGYASVTNTTISNDGVTDSNSVVYGDGIKSDNQQEDDNSKSNDNELEDDNSKSNDIEPEKLEKDSFLQKEIQQRDMMQPNMYSGPLTNSHKKTLVRRPAYLNNRGIATFAFFIFLTIISIAIGYFVFTIVR